MVKLHDTNLHGESSTKRCTYPCLPFKLVVKVRLLTPAQQRQHRGVVPVDRIDPCNVAVLPHEDGVHFFMLRNKGIDRTP